ncbi:MAG: hypothetical protein ABSE49_20085 [Polyangiaceae bacterium]
MAELHYAVCTRCGMILRGSHETLGNHHIARGSRGDLVIKATHRVGCSVCGQVEVEVRWGVPPSITAPSPPRVASFAARRAFE